MCKQLSSVSRWCLALALVLAAQPGAAQEQERKLSSEAAQATTSGDAGRDRVLRAVGQGDTAGAEKIFSELAAGSAAKAAPGIQNGSVFFEEIKACGFYPQETRLECILDIKRLFGYFGPAPSRATHEFVYFCVDWNCNGSFSADEAVGMGIVHMHDELPGPVPPIPSSQPVWQYAVYRDIDPPGSLSRQCHMRTGKGGVGVQTTTGPITLKARAILSWFAPVTGCNTSPLPWGNFIDFRIRLDPVR